MKKRSNKTKLIYLLSILVFLTSCAPGPPPPPLMFPGSEWVIITVVILLGVFLLKRISTKKPMETNYITDALNAINQQLKELEKKIDELEKKQDRKRNN